MRFLLTVFGWLIFSSFVQAQAAPVPKHVLSAAAFALRQIKHGNNTLNFDDNCPGNPTPGLAKESKDPPPQTWPTAWLAPCRTLNGPDLIRILDKATRLGSLMIEGVNLVETPDEKENRIYLYSVRIPIYFKIFYSHIADSLDLENANLKELDIEHTDFTGGLSTNDMILDDDFKLDTDHFADGADLKEMNVKHYVLLSSLVGDKDLQVNAVSVDGYLFLQNELQFRTIDLSESSIGKTLKLSNLVSNGAILCERCKADELDISWDATHQSAFNGDLDFSGSTFDNDLQIHDARFSGYTNFENIDAGNINISNTLFKKEFSLKYANVQGVVSFYNVSRQILDLSDSSIGKALDIATIHRSWRQSGELDVSNTSTGTFTDCEAAWPARINLDGFSYKEIGISPEVIDKVPDTVGADDDQAADKSDPILACTPIDRAGAQDPARGWTDFLLRNQDLLRKQDLIKTFNPQPYTSLAKYFADQGNNKYANAILYASRRRTTCNAWSTGDYVRAIGLGFLWLFAGFGISGHAIGHLSGTIAVSVGIAWVVLRRSNEAKKKTRLWCFGACVARLLPIVKLLKEFDDYFDEPDADPEHPKLAGWQKVFFSLYALWGWIIGFLLVAVLSGVTQAP